MQSITILCRHVIDIFSYAKYQAFTFSKIKIEKRMSIPIIERSKSFEICVVQNIHI